MRTPGLVDLQVNGFAGVDFNVGLGLTAAALDHALAAMRATGVTTCLPTVITALPSQLVERLHALDTAIAGSRLGPLMCPGFHLEGPFLDPAPGYAGCHPAASMTDPDYALVEALEAGLSRPILLLTLDPARAGAIGVIRRARQAGKLVAVGHSAATRPQIGAAARAGASLSTHLGNGLPAMLPKLDSTLMAQLAEDRMAATFIADGIHVPPYALGVLMRAKGPGRCLLVTDAVAAAAAPPGRYPFAGMIVERGTDGTVRVPGAPMLAGSSLCLDQAVRNLVDWGLATAAEAIAMASTAPAALLAPALAAHGLPWSPGALDWSDTLHSTVLPG